jgi:adenylosuccinate lyase
VFPEICLFTGAALTYACRLLDGLEVDTERMSANVAATGGYVLSEPVMRALAQHVGKHVAHQVVYEASLAGREQGLSLEQALLADARVTEHLTPDQIAECLDPRAALGAAGAFVDRVVGHRAVRAGRP